MSKAWLTLLVFLGLAATGLGAPVNGFFQEGTAAYQAADYARAGAAFERAARSHPASGALQNLGIARWQQGLTGQAVLAWEQVLWIDPLNGAARNNLRFARKMAQLESPDLAWYEVVSTWMPADWWAWGAAASFWLAAGMTLLPGFLRYQKATWHQAVAAVGLMVFLLCIPALFGIHARSRLGFILQKDTALRLTPTAEAQVITRFSAGEPARWERVKGRYYLVRTARGQGWLDKDELGLIGSL